MDNKTDTVLRQLRDFVIKVPSVYKAKVPLTYGVSISKVAYDPPAVGDGLQIGKVLSNGYYMRHTYSSYFFLLRPLPLSSSILNNVNHQG